MTGSWPGAWNGHPGTKNHPTRSQAGPLPEKGEVKGTCCSSVHLQRAAPNFTYLSSNQAPLKSTSGKDSEDEPWHRGLGPTTGQHHQRSRLQPSRRAPDASSSRGSVKFSLEGQPENRTVRPWIHRNDREEQENQQRTQGKASESHHLASNRVRAKEDPIIS